MVCAPSAAQRAQKQAKQANAAAVAPTLAHNHDGHEAVHGAQMMISNGIKQKKTSYLSMEVLVPTFYGSPEIV
jgi:hydroxymethylpyrimidine/phosphomethylpyrimidine kinase